MNDEIKVQDGPMTEKQQNRQRIGLLKVAESYPLESRSRKILIEQVEISDK